MPTANAGKLISTGQQISVLDPASQAEIMRLLQEAVDLGSVDLREQFERGLEFIGSGTTEAQEFLDPFRTGGSLAMNRALGLQGLGPNAVSPAQLQEQFLAQPGIQFQLDQGRRQVEASAGARGLLGSGRLAKELTRFGQGLAGQQFNTQQDQLARLAGLGANAAAQSASLTQGQGQQQAGLLSSLGQSLADLRLQASSQRASALANNRITNKLVGNDFGQRLTLRTHGKFEPGP